MLHTLLHLSTSQSVSDRQNIYLAAKLPYQYLPQHCNLNDIYTFSDFIIFHTALHRSVESTALITLINNQR